MLEKSVIGQPQALDMIMGSLERYHAGLHDDQRPIGAFLFCGPTGSGKTHTVQVLAQELLAKEAFIRLDCSEFALEQDVAKIFGAAPGYIGSDAPGMLTKLYNAIPNKENGFILLLDEVEKANRKFFDTWLQVLDAGILTDSKGNKLDFTRALIFMTSNVGAEHYGENPDIGFRPTRATEKSTNARVDASIKQTFKPEFINRLSGTVYFSPLTKEQQGVILGNLMDELNTKLARHFIRAELSPAMFTKLIDKGFSKEYGARELKRVLRDLVEQPLARLIIDRTVEPDSLIELVPVENQLTVRRLGHYPILMEEATASA